MAKATKTAKGPTKPKTDNPLGNAMDFYLDQFEESAPTAKQAIRDWYAFYDKILDGSVSLQEELLKVWAAKKEDSTSYLEKSKAFTKKVMTMQRDIAIMAVDMAVENVRSFRNKPGKPA